MGAGVEIVAQHQPDLGLDPRLQQPGERNLLVVAVATLGEEGAEVGPVDAELGLHGGRGEPDLAAADTPAALVDHALDVVLLHAICRLGIGADQVADGGTRHAGRGGVPQPVGGGALGLA